MCLGTYALIISYDLHVSCFWRPTMQTELRQTDSIFISWEVHKGDYLTKNNSFYAHPAIIYWTKLVFRVFCKQLGILDNSYYITQYRWCNFPSDCCSINLYCNSKVTSKLFSKTVLFNWGFIFITWWFVVLFWT